MLLTVLIDQGRFNSIYFVRPSICINGIDTNTILEVTAYFALFLVSLNISLSLIHLNNGRSTLIKLFVLTSDFLSLVTVVVFTGYVFLYLNAYNSVIIDLKHLKIVDLHLFQNNCFNAIMQNLDDFTFLDPVENFYFSIEEHADLNQEELSEIVQDILIEKEFKEYSKIVVFFGISYALYELLIQFFFC